MKDELRLKQKKRRGEFLSKKSHGMDPDILLLKRDVSDKNHESGKCDAFFKYTVRVIVNDRRDGWAMVN